MIILAAIYVFSLLAYLKIQLYFVRYNDLNTKEKLLVLLAVASSVCLLVIIIYLVVKYITFKVSTQTISPVRLKLYNSLIKQPCEFFHSPENSTGNLTALLSTDIDTLSSMSIESYLHLFYVFMIYSLAAGVIFYLDWKTGLIYCSWLPVSMIIVILQSRQEISN